MCRFRVRGQRTSESRHPGGSKNKINPIFYFVIPGFLRSGRGFPNRDSKAKVEIKIISQIYFFNSRAAVAFGPKELPNTDIPAEIKIK